MEFCTIQSGDDKTASSLMKVYPESNADIYAKEYAGRFASEAAAWAAFARDYAGFIAEFVRQDDRYIFALREGGAIAAALRVIRISQGNWYLEALGTLPERRGQGLARRLLRDAARCMRTLCARSIVSVVRADNTASRAAHEACGFVNAGKTARDAQGSLIEDCLVYRYDYLQ
jgi:L-amino acid N-acyltransferase YncA